MSKPIKLAGGIILDEEGRVLLLRRRAFDGLPPVWEVPGGKVEPGEDPEAAALREIHEELGIVARVVFKLGSAEFRHAGSDYTYDWFRMEVDEGIPMIGEPDLHDDFEYHNLRAWQIGRIGLSLGAEKLVWAIQNEEVQLY